MGPAAGIGALEKVVEGHGKPKEWGGEMVRGEARWSIRTKGGGGVRPGEAYVAGKLLKLVAELLDELLAPVVHPLSDKGLERGDVHGLLTWVSAQQPQHGELRTDCLARASAVRMKDANTRPFSGMVG